MPSSHTDAPHITLPAPSPYASGGPRPPRVVLRQLVSDLSAAARAGCSPATAAELRAAAAVINHSDPRFWGGAEGVDEALVADLIAASLRSNARMVHCAEVRRYVDSARAQMATLAAQLRKSGTHGRP